MSFIVTFWLYTSAYLVVLYIVLTIEYILTISLSININHAVQCIFRENASIVNEVMIAIVPIIIRDVGALSTNTIAALFVVMYSSSSILCPPFAIHPPKTTPALIGWYLILVRSIFSSMYFSEKYVSNFHLFIQYLDFVCGGETSSPALRAFSNSCILLENIAHSVKFSYVCLFSSLFHFFIMRCFHAFVFLFLFINEQYLLNIVGL